MEVVGQVDALRGGRANVGRAVVDVPLAVLALETLGEGGGGNAKSPKFPILFCNINFKEKLEDMDEPLNFILHVGGPSLST